MVFLIFSIFSFGDTIILSLPTSDFNSLITFIIFLISAWAKVMPSNIFSSLISLAPDSIMTVLSGEIKKIIKVINELKSEVGKDKIIVSPNENIEKIKNIIKKDYHKEIEKLVEDRISKEREGDEVSVLIDTIATAYPETFDKKDIEKAVDSVLKETIRKNILDKNKRPDGRSDDEIRDIESEVGLLPRTHGSAMFRRGQTQVLTVATLGSPSLEQLIESPEGETAKRYIHHY